jgi:hypothetical protein
MKRLLVCAILMSMPLASSIRAQEAQNESVQQMTVQEYDQQIASLKSDIDHYNGLASVYGEQSQLVEFRDFSGYRDLTQLQERCLAIVQELKEHLKILQQRRDALIQASSTPNDKEKKN